VKLYQWQSSNHAGKSKHLVMKPLFAAFAIVLFASSASIADDIESVPAAGGTLLIEWRGSFSAAEKQKLLSWQESVARTMSLLHGGLPRNPIRVAMQPYSSSSAVPFARVLRQDPQGVLFYINPKQPEHEFIVDWTAYHEFSHLFIPYPGMSDIWFSEGLASYYQNVLQFRAGLLTGAEARQKLLAGFERGRDDNSHQDLTLGELSSAMRKRHAYMRVYWSGALYFLEADLALRKQPESTAGSLDDILREFGTCCLNSDRDWNGLAIAGEFDRIAGRQLFVPLFKRFEQSRAIPDYLEILQSEDLQAILPVGAANLDLAVQ